MSDERDILQKKLRRLHLDDPDPVLRTRTLNVMREELDRPRRTPAWLAWLTTWSTEALYAAAVALALVFLPRLDRPIGEWGREIGGREIGRRETTAASVHDEAIVHELGLAGDLANHVRARLALQRDLRSKKRSPSHDIHRHEKYLRY